MNPTWTVPRMWEGEQCFIVGGGSSFYKQAEIPNDIISQVLSKELSPSSYISYLSFLSEKHVIGVNMAYKLNELIDIVFFGDVGFWTKQQAQLLINRSMKVTIHNGDFKDSVKVLLKDKGLGLSKLPDRLCWNGNSGAAAINLAVHTGVKQIILLGFDMNLDQDKNQHWHKEYATPLDKVQDNFTRHLKGFPKIASDAKEMGVEILNANPDSAIDVFTKVNLKDIL